LDTSAAKRSALGMGFIGSLLPHVIRTSVLLRYSRDTGESSGSSGRPRVLPKTGQSARQRRQDHGA
jgi:hypothetical protein